MPVYNGKATIQEAIESVLNQTLEDWEFLIYDDGSTDGTVEYLNYLDDPRLRIFFSQSNHGYAHWLNRGLKEAKGVYIARLDADDICLTNRFQQQVDMLSSNERLAMVGCNVMWIDAKGKDIQQKSYPENDVAIRWELLCDNPFCHPGVMMRGEVIRTHQLEYREDLIPSEDYELWTRLLQHGEAKNLQEVLLKYRVHEGQISYEKRATQLNHHDEVVAAELGRWLDPVPDSCVRLALRQIWQGGLIQDLPSGVSLTEVCRVVEKLHQKFEECFDTGHVCRWVTKRNRNVWQRLFNKAGMIGKLKLIWAWARTGLIFKFQECQN